MAASADELGARVRAWRVHQGLSQSEVERRAGLAHNAISRIETGEVGPRLATLERIADAMGMSIEQLQFKLPTQRQTMPASSPGPDASARLMELIDSLPVDRREEVLSLLIQMLTQVRR